MSESISNPRTHKSSSGIAGVMFAVTGLLASCSGEAGVNTSSVPAEVIVPQESTDKTNVKALSIAQQKRLIIARATAQNILDVTCGQLGTEFKQGNGEVERSNMSLSYTGAKFILRKSATRPDGNITVTEAVTESLRNSEPKDCESVSVFRFPTDKAYADYVHHVQRDSKAHPIDPDTILRTMVHITSPATGHGYIWSDSDPEKNLGWDSIDVDTVIQYGVSLHDTSQLGPSTHSLFGIGNYSIDSTEMTGVEVPTRKQMAVLQSAQDTFYEALSQ